MKYQDISRKSTWLVIIIIAIVLLTLLYLIVIRESGDPLAKFSDYFKSGDIVHIEYAAEDNEKWELWADYKNGKFKEVSTKKGKVKIFTLSDKKSIITYDDYESNISKERFNPKSEPWLLHTARAAIEGRLKREREKGDISYYVYENYDQKSDPRWVSSVRLGLRNADGKIKFLMDDEMISIVIKMEVLPASETKEIFNLEPLPEEIKAKADKPGYTPEALHDFKAFTPYWLGLEVNGVKASNIESTKISGEPLVYVAYGSVMEPYISINEFKYDKELGKSEWSITLDVKRIHVAGFPAKLQGTNRLVVKAGSTIVRIDGNGLKGSSELIKVVDENLEKVPK